MESRLRRFADRETKVADEWHAGAETKSQWRLGNPVGTGESQSLYITSESGLNGIAKPALQGEMPRAAHEKIASDLASLIDIPVPPVTLWLNPEGGAPFAISLMAFRQPLTWGQSASARANPDFMANVAEAMAAGYVFHVWIGCTDHGGNDGNVLVDAESAPDHPGIAFIDHAFSMSYSWADASAPLNHIGAYYIAYDLLPKDAVANAVKRVQDISAQAIEDIVRRIPVSFLPETRASLIVDGLRSRQKHLAGFFGI